MKTKVIIALALLVSSFSFSQKDELKAAEKALKNNNFADAKTAIQSAEALIGSADDKTKAKFYYLKGQALYADGNGSNDDINAAIESFNMVKTVEEKSGKSKYSTGIDALKQDMLAKILTKANAALQDKKYLVSSAGFNQAYRMSPKDTLYLYYAASTAVTAQDYDISLKYYEELRDLNYTGIQMEYVATNKATGEVEPFGSKQLRDLALKGGDYILPKDEKTDSKAGEIIKNIALIYNSQGKDDKAIAAIKEARAENPDDLSLILTEADLESKLGNAEKAKGLYQEAIVKDPNNQKLRYNIGVMTMKEGDYDTARKSFEEALKLDPTMKDAALNISTTYIDEGNVLLEEMNKLLEKGTDAAYTKYDELKVQKSNLYQEGANVLERFLENNPNGSNDVYQQLNNIYLAIGEVEKAKMYKAKIKQ